MRRLPLLAAVAAVSAFAATLAAPAAAAPNRFVLRGDRTAWVDVPVGKDGLDFRSIAVRTKGRFAGVYGEQRSVSPQSAGSPLARYGLLVVRGFTDDVGPLVLGNAPSGFSAGVVRVYLIADGPTTVTVETSRATGLAPKPVHRVPASLATTAWKAGPRGSASVPIALAKRSLTLVALAAEGTLPAAARVEACVTRAAACPEDGPLSPNPFGGYVNNWWDRDAAFGWVHEYGPGALGGGRHTARFTLEHVADFDAARAVAFTLALG